MFTRDFRSPCVVFAFAVLLAEVGRAADVEPNFSNKQVRALLTENCFDCHGDGANEGDFALDKLLTLHESGESTETTRASWWAVLKNVRAGTMPPPDSGYSIASDMPAFKTWLLRDALAIDFENPDPGEVGVRRLNRREYENTIRSILGVDFSATVVFPPDDTGAGFDTVGDALMISPMMMEKYIATATDLVDQAVPKVTKILATVHESDSLKTTDGKSARSLPMSREATVRVQFEIPVENNYQIETTLVADGTFAFSPQRCGVQLLLDGEAIHEGEYAWAADAETTISRKFRLSAGEHTLEYQLVPLPVPPDEASKAEEDAQAFLRIPSIAVRGPLDESLWKNPPDYDRFFDRESPPTDPSARRQYAARLLERFLLKAYRRPPESKQVARVVALAEQAYSQPGVTFEAGIATAMKAILASPRFLMKLESAHPPQDDSGYADLDDYALASRLSYFLWGSMPDDELFAIASKGELRSQLTNQVTRMIDDPRSKNFLNAFVGQWLRTDDVQKVALDVLATFDLREDYDKLQEEYQPLRRLDESERSEEQQRRYTELRAQFAKFRPYRDMFDDEMRKSMKQETLLLVEHVFRNDRPLEELLNPGYAFLNEPLADLYEIDGVKGDSFRLVKLDADHPRGGILTQGTLLTVTSNPTRTSPVKRGLYVLENILGTPTPPAPPNVPELEQSKDLFDAREPTLRELLEAHRESALCSSCHSRMDPLGLALENFNALGKYRTTDAGGSIAPAGRLITGESFENIVELRRVLAEDRREDFYRCLVEKLFVYAVGRDIQHFDEYSIEQIVAELLTSEATFKSAILQLVTKPAFSKTRR